MNTEEQMFLLKAIYLSWLINIAAAKRVMCGCDSLSLSSM